MISFFPRAPCPAEVLAVGNVGVTKLKVSLFLCTTVFSRQVSGRFEALAPGKGGPWRPGCLPSVSVHRWCLAAWPEAYMARRRRGGCVLSYLRSPYLLRCGWLVCIGCLWTLFFPNFSPQSQASLIYVSFLWLL